MLLQEALQAVACSLLTGHDGYPGDAPHGWPDGPLASVQEAEALVAAEKQLQLQGFLLLACLFSAFGVGLFLAFKKCILPCFCGLGRATDSAEVDLEAGLATEVGLHGRPAQAMLPDSTEVDLEAGLATELQRTLVTMGVHCNVRPSNVLVLEGASAGIESVAHRALSLMHARLRGATGLGDIAGCDEREAWTTIGDAGRGTCAVLSCVSVLAGLVFSDIGPSHAFIEGLGSVRRSGGGSCLVEGLQSRALEAGKEMLFLVPEDDEARNLWVSQGFWPCNVSQLGLDQTSLADLEECTGLSKNDLMFKDLRVV